MEGYLVYGPPGSGKTAAIKQVCEQNDLHYISVGDVTRREVGSGSEIGKRLKHYLDIPLEYPPELIAEVMDNEIYAVTADGKGFVLDGYPKYEWEVAPFLEFAKRQKINVKAVLMFSLARNLAVARIAERFICPNCNLQQESSSGKCSNCNTELTKRDDDDLAFANQRYTDYENAIGPTLNQLSGHYQDLREFDAEKPLREVIDSINSYIQE